MISVTLPSRDPVALARTVANLEDATVSPLEIIAVSPAEPPRTRKARVVWVKEDEPQGPNVAHGRAALAATGAFILGWVDDHLLTPGWDVGPMMQIARWENAGFGMIMLGLRHAVERHVGTVFGIYYPFFPFARLEVAQAIGWLGEGGYERGFADADLGLRVWTRGVCQWTREPCVLVESEDLKRKQLTDGEASFTRADMTRFLSRWRWRYGKSWSVAYIRDFNIDVIPEMRPDIVDGLTIKCNNPRDFFGAGMA
jgi:hypothetical protein